MDLNNDSQRAAVQTGRVDTGLGPVQIQIVDMGRTQLFNPNTVKIAAINDSLLLGTPVGPSDISGEPGYLYRTHELQILLTKEELYRLALRTLHPGEALALLKRFGEFFEIHDDFYDPRTGEAIQV